MVAAGALGLGCPTYPGEPAEEEGEEVATAEAEADLPEEAEEEPPSPEADEGPEVGEGPGEDEGAADAEPEGAPEGDLEPEWHREDAGEPGDDGWFAASSTNGAFRIEVPGEFDDYELAPGDGEVLHVVQAQSEGVRYLAQCSEGGEPADEQLETMREELPRLGEVEEEVDIVHEGHEGTDLRLTAGVDTTIGVRTLALEDRLCQLVVEAQGTEYPQEAAERFRNSFAFDG